MTVRSEGRLRGVLITIAGLSLALALVILLAGRSSALSASTSAAPTAGDSFEPVLGLPASGVVMIGDSPASGQSWALGQIGAVPAIVNGNPYANQQVLLEHTEASGWQILPLPPGSRGHTLSAAGGSASAAGGVALITDGGIVTRDPGTEAEFQILDEPETGPVAKLLGKDELLPPKSPGATPYAVVEDGGHTGVLIAPFDDGQDMGAGVLHYDGQKWTREPITIKGQIVEAEKPAGFTPVALTCGGAPGTETSGNSPANCWLLASYRTEEATNGPSRMALFRRVSTSGSSASYEWQEQSVEDSEPPLLGELPSSDEVSVSPPSTGAQMLTATAQGVWVDLKVKEGGNEPVDVSKLLIPGSTNTAKSQGSWCFKAKPEVPSAFCPAAHTLSGSLLPEQYRSFAWPGSGSGGAGGNDGTRIITGLQSRVMLELAGESFSEVAGAGGMNGPVPGAAAFAEPNQGFIADGVSTGISVDGQGQAPLIEVTTRPAGDELGEESVPFRRPLYAVTQAPGSLPGDANAQAIAVGAEGEVTHYVPGQGWQSESLYAATSQTPPSSPPTLRGVAWPTPERAYAVGDNGAMWMWQAATGLWGPDPGKPFNFVGQLTAIAFSGVDPNVGYAVGRQGVLLHFGKSWEQEPICGPGVSETCLSAELAQVNFTSVTFAGTEAFATYRTLEGLNEVGGVAVREGAGAWHVDSGVMALLAQAHLPSTQTVLSRIAGLPDGGVVAAGPGLVIERDTPSSTWRFSPQPLPEAQSISALAAYRESSGAVRAVVSIDLDGYLNPQRWDGPNVLDGERSPFGPVDIPPLTAEGAPPAQLPPDLLPNSGYMLKETANGWLDMEHEALPDTGTEDRPDRPDPVLALLVSPSGSSGLAVGGQVGDIEGFGPSPNHETAAAMRYPASDASSDGASPAPVFTTPGKASFVVAAGAKCIASCTDFLHEGIGPEAWLAHALLSANNIAKGSAGGLRAFLYDGSQGGGEDVFSRYLSGHQEVLPTYGPEGGGAGDEPGPAGTIAYSFISEGSGGPVSVIMLDCSKLEDPKLEEAQLGWVEEKLGQAKAAKTPAIVIGADSLEFTLPEPYGPRAVFLAQAVASKLSSILIRGGASAYFFDYPESNVHAEISKPGFQALQVYGTGTLGYIDTNENSNGFHDALGSSGFLVTEVETAARNPATNVAPVNVKVVPNISQLALDATNGVLLHRSQVALFEALARRADGGEAMRQGNNPEWTGPDPYDPIPFDCRGPNCAYEVSSDYTFSSSNPDIGGFVAHDPSSEEPRQVLLGANHLAVPDEPRNANGELNAGGHFSENSKGEPVNEKGEVVARDQSGTFCPYNAGTTIVSIAAGGLTYSEPVTVQAGSVEYPCGTVPLKHPPILRAPVSTNFNVVEPSSPGPGSPNPQLQTLLPPPPPHPPLHHKPPHHRRPHVTPAAFLPAAAGLALLRPAILPPPPTAARPSPPSGTSSAQVYQSAVAPESEREEQEAIDMVHNMAVYSREPRRPVPYYLPAVILLLALAGAGLYDAGRRARPRLARNGQE